jgi:hypothetical protein
LRQQRPLGQRQRRQHGRNAYRADDDRDDVCWSSDDDARPGIDADG